MQAVIMTSDLYWSMKWQEILPSKVHRVFTNFKSQLSKEGIPKLFKVNQYLTQSKRVLKIHDLSLTIIASLYLKALLFLHFHKDQRTAMGASIQNKFLHSPNPMMTQEYTKNTLECDYTKLMPKMAIMKFHTFLATSQ